jgi:T5SS/PEP-CTERM-associated repeat protein
MTGLLEPKLRCSITIENDARIGDDGTGSMTQTGGVFDVGDDMTLGNNTDSDGSYSLSGAGSQLLVDDRISVGNNGKGTFTMTDGTVQAEDFFLADSDNGDGTVTLSGGTITIGDDFRVSDQGMAAMIQTGGTLIVGDDLRIASSSSTTGDYALSGAASKLDVGGEMAVGRDGTGTFTQTAGDVDVNGLFYVGQNTSGDGTYDMSGGTLDITNRMRVGNSGTGVFRQSGGDVTVGNNLDLEIGRGGSGTGTYELSDGSLTVDDDLVVGHENSGTGFFTQTGGSITVDDEFRFGQDGGTSGSYTISGGTVDTSKLTNGQGGTGTFIILGSAATINVSDDYSQNGNSELNPQIGNGGVSLILVDDDVPGHSGSHDNTASLDGDIRMGVYGGVALTAGDSFTILTVENSRNGTLNNLTAAMWDITYPGNDVVATLLNSLGTFAVGGSPTEIPLPIDGLSEGNLILTDTGMFPSMPVFLAVQDTGGAMLPPELAELAAYIASAGQQVIVKGGAGWPGESVAQGYDLMLLFDGPADPSHLVWDFAAYNSAHNSDVRLVGIAAGVPEPATMALLGLAACGLGGYLRRRRKA